MDRERFRSILFWTLALGLLSLASEAPLGFRQFSLTAMPTRIYYIVLAAGGAGLLVAGAGLWRAQQLDRGALLVACVAALVLGLNQVTGIALNTIVCFSGG